MASGMYTALLPACSVLDPDNNIITYSITAVMDRMQDLIGLPVVYLILAFTGQ
jgi:hypothetical protein